MPNGQVIILGHGGVWHPGAELARAPLGVEERLLARAQEILGNTDSEF
jgi:hypothetical protein